MTIAGLVLFFIGAVLLLCYPGVKKKNTRCSMQTQGILTQTFETTNDSTRTIYVYSYNADGVPCQLKTFDRSPQTKDVGDACVIWYNPAKPAEAQAFRPSNQYLKTLLSIGIAAALLGAVLMICGFIRPML